MERFRSMLQTEESRSTSNVRLRLARNLAEVLLHSVSDDQYKPPDIGDSPKRGGRHNVQSVSAVDSPWKPRKYCGNALFVPSTRHEEVVLLLLLGETMASKHVPLNQTPEYDSHRQATMYEAKRIFNLMTLACASSGQYKVVSDMFERSLRFSPKDEHVWSQFALSLACEARFMRSLVVLTEVAQQNPQDSSVCLLAARLCYEKLEMLGEGVSWSRRALEREERSPQELGARCHLYLGIGLYLQSQESETREDCVELGQAAYKHLQVREEVRSLNV